MAIINSADLDFDTIKEDLKTYLQRQEEFADYDFEASGLSNILDVLAYNTHLNGLVANLAINESFLSSSQLRSSALSHAETLGYYPRSQTGSQAIVNLTLNTSVTDVTSITIPRFTTFTASVDQISYTFQTLETYVANNDGSGVFAFATNTGSTSIPLFEGIQKTKTFLVGDASDDQVYVIPDENVDTATVRVNVYDTSTSSSFTPYVDVNNVARINSDSTVYILREAPNGFFEITFSDGNILGQRPVAGNKIIVEYLQTSGSSANGCKVFVADQGIEINEVTYPVNVTLVAASSGGDEKESIESIKLNAPLSFASQQRLVTAEDYKALIFSNFSSILDDVAAWGGQDNIPAEFGKVFVSLKFKPNISDSVKQTTQDNIISNLTNNLSVMSISTEFTEEVNVFLEVATRFNFDPDLSGSSLQTVESSIQSLIEDFFENNLNRFGAIFRRSNILTRVDDFSPAVLNSRMDIKVQQRITPSLNTVKDYSVNYPMKIASPNNLTFTVQSSRFTFNNQTCIIRNQLDNTKLQLLTAAGSVIQDNVGQYNSETGVVDLQGLSLQAFQGEALKISVVPANQSTIKPLRNYVINIDRAASFSQGIVDYQETEIALL